MSQAIYIKIGDIKGESTDDDHNDGWIEVQNLSMGISKPWSSGNYSATGGASDSGKADFDSISFDKYVDKSTHGIQKLALSTESQAETIIHVCQDGPKAGDPKHVIIAVTLENTVIADYNFSASEGDAGRPRENISLGFSNYKVAYTGLKNDNTPDDTFELEFSLEKNKVMS